MGNVLDPRTYCAPNRTVDQPPSEEDVDRLNRYDLNNIPLDERLQLCSSRGVCYSLIRWLDAHYIIKEVKSPFKEIESFSLQFIAAETAKFVALSRLGGKANLGFVGFSTAKGVRRQVDNVMKGSPLEAKWKEVQSKYTAGDFHLGWLEAEKKSIVVSQREVPLEFECQSRYFRTASQAHPFSRCLEFW